jgi:hypothetical protein
MTKAQFRELVDQKAAEIAELHDHHTDSLRTMNEQHEITVADLQNQLTTALTTARETTEQQAENKSVLYTHIAREAYFERQGEQYAVTVVDLQNQLSEMAFHAHEVEEALDAQIEATADAVTNIPYLRHQEFLLQHAYNQQEDLADEIALIYDLIAWVFLTLASVKTYAGEDENFVSNLLNSITDELLPFVKADDDLARVILDELSEETEAALVIEEDLERDRAAVELGFADDNVGEVEEYEGSTAEWLTTCGCDDCDCDEEFDPFDLND